MANAQNNVVPTKGPVIIKLIKTSDEDVQPRPPKRLKTVKK